MCVFICRLVPEEIIPGKIYVSNEYTKTSVGAVGWRFKLQSASLLKRLVADYRACSVHNEVGERCATYTTTATVMHVLRHLLLK